jgi:glycosyltransferase involved in cell wall biosynthesis
MFTETFLPQTDGIVTRLCATLRHLEAHGHQVLLFAPEGAPSKYGCAEVVSLPSFRFFLYPEKNFAFPRPRIKKALQAFEPDLIHVVNPAFLGIGGIYYAKRFGIPLVASYHTNVPAYARHYRLNWLEPLLWWYFRTLHNTAAVNLCTSKATLEELDKRGFRNLALWERGVDVSLYSRAKRSDKMRSRFGCSADEMVVLYVGRLAAEKGIERLRPCLDEFSNLRFVVIGDGPHRGELERIFRGTRTTFMGYMHGEELAEAYASADGFVFPSTTETLGLVLFEAMASGLPIMAADSPPTREVLENGKAGFIFDANDTASLFRVMSDLLYNESARQEKAMRGLSIAKTLDWLGPTKQLMSHYERLVSETISISHTGAQETQI